MSASVSDEYVSAHDPLCLASGRPSAWEPEMCICDVIAQVREDERLKDLDYAYIAAQAEADGQRDMLAKCIAAVEYLHDHEAPHDAHRDALWNAISALRALQEKP